MDIDFLVHARWSKKGGLSEPPRTPPVYGPALGCMKVHLSCIVKYSACGGGSTPQRLSCGIIVQLLLVSQEGSLHFFLPSWTFFSSHSELSFSGKGRQQ